MISGLRIARARCALAAAVLALVAACSSGPPPEQVRAQQEQAAHAVANGPCPPDGTWKECSLAERLLRAGLVLRRDSTPVHEDSIATAGVLYHIGVDDLEVFFFADSAARRAAAARLDAAQFVGYDQSQTSRGERSLIQSANLLALLASRRDQQRERIGDAITAGPPQPPGRAK